jgi:hypothetical protein
MLAPGRHGTLEASQSGVPREEKAGFAPSQPEMNWLLLNVPLCVAAAAAVVTPILIVTAREPLGIAHTGPSLHELAVDLRG